MFSVYNVQLEKRRGGGYNIVFTLNGKRYFYNNNYLSTEPSKIVIPSIEIAEQYVQDYLDSISDSIANIPVGHTFFIDAQTVFVKLSNENRLGEIKHIYMDIGNHVLYGTDNDNLLVYRIGMDI